MADPSRLFSALGAFAGGGGAAAGAGGGGGEPPRRGMKRGASSSKSSSTSRSRSGEGGEHDVEMDMLVSEMRHVTAGGKKARRGPSPVAALVPSRSRSSASSRSRSSSQRAHSDSRYVWNYQSLDSVEPDQIPAGWFAGGFELDLENGEWVSLFCIASTSQIEEFIDHVAAGSDRIFFPDMRGFENIWRLEKQPGNVWHLWGGHVIQSSGLMVRTILTSSDIDQMVDIIQKNRSGVPPYPVWSAEKEKKYFNSHFAE